MTTEDIKKLVKEVIDREKRVGLSYPNLLGGRKIDKMFGRNLTHEEWTDFHELYNKINNPYPR